MSPGRRRKRRIAIALGTALALSAAIAWWLNMRGSSHSGPLPDITADQNTLATRLRQDVEALAHTIGQRNLGHRDGLARAADLIEGRFKELGLTTRRQEYKVRGVTCANIEASLAGTSPNEPILVIGAHYDSVEGTAGANDNASGVAALLAVARALKDTKPARGLRLVAFVNEEPPYFQTPEMGSMVYAKAAHEAGERIVGMISFDGLGYYRDEKGSQNYPFPMNLIYPDTANFIGFVGNIKSRQFTDRVVGLFREHAAFPSQGASIPAAVPGAGWSDHWSFWQYGYPALMVTDTLPFRYPHYHTPQDTADQINYEKMARVVEGLIKTIDRLAAAPD